MAFQPNNECGSYAYWLLNVSWFRFTGPQTTLITLIYNAAIATTTVTDEQWKNFNQITAWRYKYYEFWTLNNSSYTAAAEAYFHQMFEQPSIAFKNAVNTFIAQCQTDGNWSLLDVFYLFGTELQQHATLNMVNPGVFTIIEKNSPTWTPNLGYTGNGSSMYLDTTFVPFTDGVNFTLNSACVGAYNRTSGNHAGEIFGINQGGKIALYPQFTDGKSYYSANASTEANFTSADRVSALNVVRSNSTTVALYNRGASQNSQTISSVSVPSGRMFVLANNQSGTANNWTNKQISAFWMGSASINQATFYTALQALATSLGFNV